MKEREPAVIRGALTWEAVFSLFSETLENNGKASSAHLREGGADFSQRQSSTPAFKFQDLGS